MKKCKVEGCESRVQVKGYCSIHYKRYIRHGDPNISKRNVNQPKVCSIENCNGETVGLGYCLKHYKKLKKYNNPLGKAVKKEPRKCSIEGCEGKYHANGYCSAHNSRLRKYGDPLGKPEERQVKLSGGKRVPGQGEGIYETKTKYTSYKMILCPCHPNADKKGYVREHRLIMEVHLGRFLDTKESVHHKDGNGLNNSLVNLELLNRSEHAKEHKYWSNSPTMGKGREKWLYKDVICKKEGCNKDAKSNGYCSNHDRNIRRQKKRELGLPYS